MFLTSASFVRFVPAFISVLLFGCSTFHDTTLDNGLRIVVKEDHRSPVVVSQIWYKVGSMDEPEGLTGVSHVLEHMMFKGTQKLKPNEFSRIVAENGGRENAFTSYDYTGYYQQLEKSRLAVSFELEADRMRNLTLDDAETRKEIPVVMEERRLRTDDQPEALVFEKFMATAYEVHSYRHPIIGWMRDLERLTTADLKKWYARWYTPSNATLVVVGDVQPEAVVALARQHFGTIAGAPVVRAPTPVEPTQRGVRRSRVAAPAQVPYFMMGYHVPVHAPAATAPKGQESWEPYALAMLAGVLDGGDSARFERELVRETKIAASIDADYDSIGRAPSMFIVAGTPSAGHTVADLENAVRAHIARMRDQPVSATELKRVKAQVVANDVYARDSVFYQAMQIGQLAVTGLDLDLLEERVKRFDSVTAEQVQAVARKYLTDDNMTVTVLDPLPIPQNKKPAAAAGGHGHGR